MRYSCQTLFDITATGITGHYRPSTGVSASVWNHARNQQRNWETLQQIISLRTQVFELTQPELVNGRWQFSFEVETASVFGGVDDPTAVLRLDAAGVPMMNNLDNSTQLPTCLIVTGAEQNIWFQQEPINNS